MTTDLPIHPDQAELVAALENGSASGEPGPLKRVDTHMSHLFLGRDRAYKLKRSLRHPFADLSSLAARKRLCEAELEINRALAPGLYLGVEPLVRAKGGAIQLGGAGEPLDYLVIMRRFDDGALLNELADRNALGEAQIEEAAQVVAAFHAGLPPLTETGHAPDYHRIIAGLRATEAEAAARQGVEAASEPLFAALEHEVARVAPMIEARRRQGQVRRGHGDLHLRNICLFEGRVTPFDALEFDARLATGDVLYDIAFLFMDLRARGLGALANRAMNAYWDASDQDEAALMLLPLFMAMRAAIRMAVAVEAGDLAEAARYRGLASELLHRHPPHLVAVGGLSGTGKSTLAKALAPKLGGPCGARILRTDLIRKAGKANARLGPGAYSPAARGAVYQQMAAMAEAALQARASVIADATFQAEDQRRAIEQAGQGDGFFGLWLQAPLDVRLGRVASREHDASDATVDVARAQQEPGDLGPDWHVLDASLPVAALIEASLAIIAR